MKIQLVIIVVLFCLIITAPFGRSNPEPYPPPLPVVSVTSPSSTINVHDTVLTVEVRVFAIPTIVRNGSFYTQDVDWLNFSIDNQLSTAIVLQNKGTITPKVNDTQNPFNGDPYVLWVGTNALSGLPDGTHTISIQGQTKYLNNTLQKFYSFTVDSTPPTSTPTPSPTEEPTLTQQLTPTPSVPEFSWLVILPLLFSVFSIVVLFKYQKVKKL
jgi:hypothetical protein